MSGGGRPCSGGAPEPGPPHETIDEIVHHFVSIWNPQFRVRGPGGDEPGEAELLRAICRWLDVRGIPYESDVTWGVHAELTSPDGDADRPAVLLSAHLDSDCLSGDRGGMSNILLDTERRELQFTPEVGLDCKTGVAIALSVLERLRAGEVPDFPPRWRVHVLFTVGEESGQKGAIRAPLPRLLAGRVRHAIVVDRQTGGRGAPKQAGRYLRHVVNQYKGVPLLDPRCDREMMELLRLGMAFAGEVTDRVPAVESPNCADALELRGRWDAEVLAPRLLERPSLPEGTRATIQEALARYSALTDELRLAIDQVPPQTRVSSMNANPRKSRYEAMQKVYDALHRRDNVIIEPELWFSCVNLSYDYSDDRSVCSVIELETTQTIVIGFLKYYFEAASTP